MKDFRCPDVSSPAEYFQVQSSRGGRDGPVLYEIPRSCVEALGIDTGGRATWFTKEQAEKMRSHRYTHPSKGEGT